MAQLGVNRFSRSFYGISGAHGGQWVSTPQRASRQLGQIGFVMEADIPKCEYGDLGLGMFLVQTGFVNGVAEGAFVLKYDITCSDPWIAVLEASDIPDVSISIDKHIEGGLENVFLETSNPSGWTAEDGGFIYGAEVPYADYRITVTGTATALNPFSFRFATGTVAKVAIEVQTRINELTGWSDWSEFLDLSGGTELEDGKMRFVLTDTQNLFYDIFQYRFRILLMTSDTDGNSPVVTTLRVTGEYMDAGSASRRGYAALLIKIPNTLIKTIDGISAQIYGDSYGNPLITVHTRTSAADPRVTPGTRPWSSTAHVFAYTAPVHPMAEMVRMTMDTALLEDPSRYEGAFLTQIQTFSDRTKYLSASFNAFANFDSYEYDESGDRVLTILTGSQNLPRIVVECRTDVYDPVSIPVCLTREEVVGESPDTLLGAWIIIGDGKQGSPRYASLMRMVAFGDFSEGDWVKDVFDYPGLCNSMGEWYGNIRFKINFSFDSALTAAPVFFGYSTEAQSSFSWEKEISNAHGAAPLYSSRVFSERYTNTGDVWLAPDEHVLLDLSTGHAASFHHHTILTDFWNACPLGLQNAITYMDDSLSPTTIWLEQSSATGVVVRLCSKQEPNDSLNPWARYVRFGVWVPETGISNPMLYTGDRVRTNVSRLNATDDLTLFLVARPTQGVVPMTNTGYVGATTRTVKVGKLQAADGHGYAYRLVDSRQNTNVAMDFTPATLFDMQPAQNSNICGGEWEGPLSIVQPTVQIDVVEPEAGNFVAWRSQQVLGTIHLNYGDPASMQEEELLLGNSNLPEIPVDIICRSNADMPWSLAIVHGTVTSHGQRMLEDIVDVTYGELEDWRETGGSILLRRAVLGATDAVEYWKIRSVEGVYSSMGIPLLDWTTTLDEDGYVSAIVWDFEGDSDAPAGQEEYTADVIAYRPGLLWVTLSSDYMEHRTVHSFFNIEAPPIEATCSKASDYTGQPLRVSDFIPGPPDPTVDETTLSFTVRDDNPFVETWIDDDDRVIGHMRSEEGDSNWRPLLHGGDCFLGEEHLYVYDNPAYVEMSDNRMPMGERLSYGMENDIPHLVIDEGTENLFAYSAPVYDVDTVDALVCSGTEVPDQDPSPMETKTTSFGTIRYMLPRFRTSGTRSPEWMRVSINIDWATVADADTGIVLLYDDSSFVRAMLTGTTLVVESCNLDGTRSLLGVIPDAVVRAGVMTLQGLVTPLGFTIEEATGPTILFGCNMVCDMDTGMGLYGDIPLETGFANPQIEGWLRIDDLPNSCLILPTDTGFAFRAKGRTNDVDGSVNLMSVITPEDVTEPLCLSFESSGDLTVSLIEFPEDPGNSVVQATGTSSPLVVSADTLIGGECRILVQKTNGGESWIRNIQVEHKPIPTAWTATSRLAGRLTCPAWYEEFDSEGNATRIDILDTLRGAIHMTVKPLKAGYPEPMPILYLDGVMELAETAGALTLVYGAETVGLASGLLDDQWNDIEISWSDGVLLSISLNGTQNQIVPAVQALSAAGQISFGSDDLSNGCLMLRSLQVYGSPDGEGIPICDVLPLEGDVETSSQYAFLPAFNPTAPVQVTDDAGEYVRVHYVDRLGNVRPWNEIRMAIDDTTMIARLDFPYDSLLKIDARMEDGSVFPVTESEQGNARISGLPTSRFGEDLLVRYTPNRVFCLEYDPTRDQFLLRLSNMPRSALTVRYEDPNGQSRNILDQVECNPMVEAENTGFVWIHAGDRTAAGAEVHASPRDTQWGDSFGCVIWLRFIDADGAPIDIPEAYLDTTPIPSQLIRVNGDIVPSTGLDTPYGRLTQVLEDMPLNGQLLYRWIPLQTCPSSVQPGDVAAERLIFTDSVSGVGIRLTLQIV